MSDEIVVDPIEQVNASDMRPKGEMSLEALILLITTERLAHLRDKTRTELLELKDRQDKVRTLHKLLRTINLDTDEAGALDVTKNPDLRPLLEEVGELGIDIDLEKATYNREERERLVENVKMAADDYNVENEMQIQSISRWTNERYETYQMARSILKPLQDDKQRKARAISGH